MKPPKILGVPMRRIRPLRFDAWTWSPRPRHSRHLSVAIYTVNDVLKVRIWALGISTCVDEKPVKTVREGAAWANKKLRGLARALRGAS